jgi:hypothetical protein
LLLNLDMFAIISIAKPQAEDTIIHLFQKIPHFINKIIWEAFWLFLNKIHELTDKDNKVYKGDSM